MTLFETVATAALTFENIMEQIENLYEPCQSWENYQRVKELIMEREEEIKAAIERKSIAELSKYCRKGTKKEMTSSMYSRFCDSLIFGGVVSWLPFQETYKNAISRISAAYTPETFEAYKIEHQKAKEERQQKREAFFEALKNPQTLADFEMFVQYKSEQELTPEQRQKYDELKADNIRERRKAQDERRATVEAVSMEGIEMEIKQSTHTKKNIPLWVVVLSARVEREKYNELNTKAKKLGGYYSSYNKGGAIPGFTFENEKAAQMFAGLQEENQNGHELKEEKQQARKLTRSEEMKEKAQEIIEKATEEMNRERLANTARRARFAASAENKAQQNINFGKTLLKIAERMEAGQIKYLDNIKNLADLEELQTVLSLAKYAHIRAENLNADNYEYSAHTADFAKIPYPVLYSNRGDIERMIKTPGKKMAAARVLKWLKGNEFIEMNTPGRLEDYETLFCNPCATIDNWQVRSYKERLMKYRRIERMKLDTPAELRAAIRELIEIKTGAQITPEQRRMLEIRELERKFINKKIDGFFPTPETLAEMLVSLAHIEPDDIILEPSAGLGHIAEAISERHPDNILHCCEIYQPLRDALDLKGFEVVAEDFLKMDEGPKYDKIVMNPPFENLQDIDHVYKAWNMLKPGGRIVAIMAGNKEGERSKIQEFRDFVEDKGGFMTNNPAGSFASAFRPTGVNTITLILDKPIN